MNYKLQKGRLLGKQYIIQEFLGNGWQGEVYKIEEVGTGIVRAAKLFYKREEFEKLPHISYAQRLNQLKTCPIVIQYHHHDIVRLKGENVHYLVSDYVDGEILEDYLGKQPQKRLQPFEALHLLYALVLGVEQIHFLKEYHGDIHSGNVIVKRRGLHFDVRLIDLLNLGKATRVRILEDVHALIDLFYEMLGGAKYYQKMPAYIKQIICGRKRQLIAKKFKTAAELRTYLDNFANE